ncbi:MAG: DUF1552 domain-containing protein [Planctomycetota bacterium]|jgi:hypothetical protein
MKSIHIARKNALPRRTVLRGLGVGLALPWLDAMAPAFSTRAQAAEDAGDFGGGPRRFFGVCNNLGVIPDNFFPKEAGRGYAMSPYLKRLEAHRDDFTVFSGVWHPDVDSGHPADNCFLTAAPHPSSGGFRNTISLDQYVAERVGHLTRFPSMTLGVNVSAGARSLSWTRAGVMIPCEESAAAVYRQMFLQGSQAQVRRQMRRLELGQSIMDAVADQVGSLERKLGPRDRERLDQYTTGVRDLEQRMAMSREWENRPKPKAPAPMPIDPQDPGAYMERVRQMYDMTCLAFQTDSTRNVTLMIDSVNTRVIDLDDAEITDTYHNLSHHGRNPKKLAQLRALDECHMKLLSELYGKLAALPEGGERLLDRTQVLYGSNMGNASTHVTTNLPVIFAGGGFKHGQHLAYDRVNNYPLPNLFVSMLQDLGVEADRFASSTGTMSGLERV